MPKMRFLFCALFALVVWSQVPEPKIPRRAPEQPLPFSHKQHAGVNKTACATCHPMPDPGDFAELPETKVCMGCHTAIKADSPHIKTLAAAHADGKKIDWKPVYRIPDWVFFNHKKHVSVQGVTCETCHGSVKERAVLHREKEISMQACMDCHRHYQAKNDCRLCHDQR